MSDDPLSIIEKALLLAEVDFTTHGNADWNERIRAASDSLGQLRDLVAAADAVLTTWSIKPDHGTLFGSALVGLQDALQPFTETEKDRRKETAP